MKQLSSLEAVTTTLTDGRPVELRPLTEADTDALIDAVHHADAFDLRRRFMGPPPPDHRSENSAGSSFGWLTLAGFCSRAAWAERCLNCPSL